MEGGIIVIKLEVSYEANTGFSEKEIRDIAKEWLSGETTGFRSDGKYMELTVG